MLCENMLVVKSQRYRWPSSLFTIADFVILSMAALLMHHSRTAPAGGESSVTPRMVITSPITVVVPLTGSSSV